MGGQLSWPETDARLRALQPEIVADRDRLIEAAWMATDPVVLELCRLRLAELMGNADARATRTPAAVAAGLDEQQVAALGAWPDSPLFDARDRAHLALAEQFSLSVAHISDDDVGALLEHVSEEQAFDFVAALYVIELDLRVRMVAQAVLTPRKEPE